MRLIYKDSYDDCNTPVRLVFLGLTGGQVVGSKLISLILINSLMVALDDRFPKSVVTVTMTVYSVSTSIPESISSLMSRLVSVMMTGSLDHVSLPLE